MSTHKYGRDKLQARAIPCLYLRYPYGKKAYKVMDLETKKIYSSRDVIFHKHVFPFPQNSSSNHMFIPVEPAYDEHSVVLPTHFLTEQPASNDIL